MGNIHGTESACVSGRPIRWTRRSDNVFEPDVSGPLEGSRFDHLFDQLIHWVLEKGILRPSEGNRAGLVEGFREKDQVLAVTRLVRELDREIGDHRPLIVTGRVLDPGNGFPSVLRQMLKKQERQRDRERSEHGHSARHSNTL